MTEQSIAEPRGDPRDTLDSDWDNTVKSILMVYRRVSRDGMKIRLDPIVYAGRETYAAGLNRMIREIVDSALPLFESDTEIEEPSND